MPDSGLKNSIVYLRELIKDNYEGFRYDETIVEFNFRYVDAYLDDEANTDLEKAFFLILNQFPSDHKDYVVRSREMILIPDVYDMRVPGIEYEIDFALFGGSIDNPVKVAIECDGLRSHGKKHVHKDRRKDVNLQAAGWIIMRFGSKEIHEEIEKFRKDSSHISYFLQSIENTIAEKLKLINQDSYHKYREKLTGYKWGLVKCPDCGNQQNDILNHINVRCRSCSTKFKREIADHEEIVYRENGLLFFK